MYIFFWGSYSYSRPYRTYDDSSHINDRKSAARSRRKSRKKRKSRQGNPQLGNYLGKNNFFFYTMVESWEQFFRHLQLFFWGGGNSKENSLLKILKILRKQTNKQKHFFFLNFETHLKFWGSKIKELKSIIRRGSYYGTPGKSHGLKLLEFMNLKKLCRRQKLQK